MAGGLLMIKGLLSIRRFVVTAGVVDFTTDGLDTTWIFGTDLIEGRTIDEFSG
jgi:hypothetical protein